jgi:hypothetical protein
MGIACHRALAASNSILTANQHPCSHVVTALWETMRSSDRYSSDKLQRWKVCLPECVEWLPHNFDRYLLWSLPEGHGVDMKRVEAAKYLKAAADQDHPRAQFEYADALEKGAGIAHDLTVAARYFKLAAARNHSDAQFHYAICLKYGNGVDPDWGGAADLGHAVALYGYGLCPRDGRASRLICAELRAISDFQRNKST